MGDNRQEGNEQLKTLNLKRLKFCQEYVVDFNGTQACIRAGYSKKTAGTQAEQLLKILEVKAKVKELIEAQTKRTEVTADIVIEELALLGFSNMMDYVIIKDGIPDIDLSVLTRKQAAAIQEVMLEKGKWGVRVKIKLTDKIRALTKLGEHLGIFNNEPAIEVNINVNTAKERIQSRIDSIIDRYATEEIPERIN